MPTFPSKRTFVKSKKSQAKRKAKLNKRRSKLTADFQKERADYFFHESLWYWDRMDHEKALTLLMKALRYDPKSMTMLEAMVDLGFELNRRLHRDVASLEEYYSALEQEMKASIERPGLSAQPAFIFALTSICSARNARSNVLCARND